jgi:hypothetical protein
MFCIYAGAYILLHWVALTGVQNQFKLIWKMCLENEKRKDITFPPFACLRPRRANGPAQHWRPRRLFLVWLPVGVAPLCRCHAGPHDRVTPPFASSKTETDRTQILSPTSTQSRAPWDLLPSQYAMSLFKQATLDRSPFPHEFRHCTP